MKRKEIDKKLFDYFHIKRPEFGRLYLLPKIHKRLPNVLGRPAISNNNTATENISVYFDYHLKSLVLNIPHILEDTRDFLCGINEIDNIPDDAIVVSFDVVGLYPNIAHEEGIETIRDYLEPRTDNTVSSNSLSDLGSIILKNNYFENGELKYHQKRGTAFGTKFTPPYSNLFMAGFKKKISENSEVKPFLWLRYLDDIFCIWTQAFQKLNAFLNCINSLHLAIKFPMDYSTIEVNFSDATVTKIGSKLETDLYCKATDTHHFVQAQSCRGNVYKKSIAYEQAVAVRRKRICLQKKTLIIKND